LLEHVILVHYVSIPIILGAGGSKDDG